MVGDLGVGGEFGYWEFVGSAFGCWEFEKRAAVVDGGIPERGVGADFIMLVEESCLVISRHIGMSLRRTGPCGLPVAQKIILFTARTESSYERSSSTKRMPRNHTSPIAVGEKFGSRCFRFFGSARTTPSSTVHVCTPTRF